MTNEKHIGLATMYDNTHGDESISIMNAISGLLEDARAMGADEADCEAIRETILTDILIETPRADIKRKLAENCYTVQIKDGYLDVGYLLSLRF